VRSPCSPSNRTSRVSAARKRSSRASGLRPRKTTASRPSSGADQDIPSPVVPPPVPKLIEVLPRRLAPGPDKSGSSSFLNMSATVSEVHLLPSYAQDNLEPRPVPCPLDDDTNGSLEQFLSNHLTDPKHSPRSSEFDDSAIPSIWLQSDTPQPKTRIRSLMALGTSRIDNERTRPASPVLSRVPSFTSFRAVTYDSDGMILSECVASLPVLEPNRNASSENVRDAPSSLLHLPSRSKTTGASSSSGDKVLSPYEKLKTITKRYTLPLHRVGGKKHAPSLPQ